MGNVKVMVKESKLGKGLFAVDKISKNETVFVFEGKEYISEKYSNLPRGIVAQTLQYGEHTWVHVVGMGRFINHSCEPNCGMKGNLTVIAMRDIDQGEELTLDYDMSENSDWQMKCECESKSCRGIIRGYRFLPESKKREYKGYISDWLTK